MNKLTAMPNPSEENPTVREVLSGYYMDFNTKLGQNGEDGAVTYLHEKNGNYVSNYYAACRSEDFLFWNIVHTYRNTKN